VLTLSKLDAEAFRGSRSLATGVRERSLDRERVHWIANGFAGPQLAVRHFPKMDRRQESLSRWQLLGTYPKCLRNAVEKFAGLA
jgi:hypothetical protein